MCIFTFCLADYVQPINKPVFVTCNSAMLVVWYKRIFHRSYCWHQPTWASNIVWQISRERLQVKNGVDSCGLHIWFLWIAILLMEMGCSKCCECFCCTCCFECLSCVRSFCWKWYVPIGCSLWRRTWFCCYCKLLWFIRSTIITASLSFFFLPPFLRLVARLFPFFPSPLLETKVARVVGLFFYVLAIQHILLGCFVFMLLSQHVCKSVLRPN